MTRSIKTRLFSALLAATGVLWLSAVMWIQYSTREEVGHVLDRRLEESAKMVASLIGRQGLPETPLELSIEGDAAVLEAGSNLLSRQLICQVWGLDGSLKSGSAGAPEEPLATGASGFSEKTINTVEGPQVWRVYTYVDGDLGIRVMVGDALSMRDGLVRDVIVGLLAPALFVLPALALLIWIGVGRGLAPLSHMAKP